MGVQFSSRGMNVSLFLLLDPSPPKPFRALSVGRRNLGLPLNVGSEVLKAVTVKCMVFLITVPYSSERVRRFSGTYHLHRQVRKISHARNQQEQAAMLVCRFS